MIYIYATILEGVSTICNWDRDHKRGHERDYECDLDPITSGIGIVSGIGIGIRISRSENRVITIFVNLYESNKWTVESQINKKLGSTSDS